MQRVGLSASLLALTLVAQSEASIAQTRTALSAPPPAQTACAAAQRAFTASIRSAQARLRPGRNVTVPTWGYNDCLPANRGVWRLTVDEPVVRALSYGHRLSGGTVNAVFYTATGVAIRAPHELLGEHGSIASWPAGSSSTVDDIDGDGLGELIVQTSATGPHSLRVLTVRNNAIEALPVPAAIRVNAVVSVDHDPQRELVEYVRFQPPTACESESGGVRPIEALTIAAFRDGAAFRADNDSARALLRSQCPERPQVIVPHHGVTAANSESVFEEVIQRVACARVWGMSAEAIVRTFPTRWPSVWSCVSPADLATFAASVRPPVTLAAMPRVAVATDAPTNYEPIDIDDYSPEGRPLDEALPSVGRACRANSTRVTATYAALVRQSQQNLTQDELDEFFGQYGNCFVGEPRDAWMSTFVRMRWDAAASSDEPGITGMGRVVYVGAHGTVADRPTVIERVYESSTLRQVFATFDFDNDGLSEALVRRYSSSSDSDGDVGIEILSARGGVVRAFEPAGGIPAFVRIADYDDDGRPDLFDDRAFMLPDDDSGTMYGLKTLAHSRPDGTFSLDDSVARDFIRAQCTAPPARVVQFENGDIDRPTTFNAILCARFYGESAERLVHRLFSDTSRLEEGDRQWLRVAAQAALWQMPFTLTAASARGGATVTRP